jgi:hypothetical protein
MPTTYKGKCNKDDDCNDAGNSCAVANQGGCCANKCCSINGSSTNGICPTKDGECCTLRQAGGYCTSEFPQCCGQATCCKSGQVCCALGGYCCNAGQQCAPSGSGCTTAQGASVEAQPSGRREGHQ